LMCFTGVHVYLLSHYVELVHIAFR
jgi:hypothetical protein